jgi:hypothetical protein
MKSPNTHDTFPTRNIVNSRCRDIKRWVKVYRI